MAEHPRANGVLIIVKADNCGACIAATAVGLFENIEAHVNIGTEGKIATIPMKMMGPTSEAAVFNLAGTFPRFMYVLARDFDRVCVSGANTEGVINLVRFFNYTYNSITKQLGDNQVELPFSLANIQTFCDTSMLSLLQQATGTAAPPQPTLVARYQRSNY